MPMNLPAAPYKTTPFILFWLILTACQSDMVKDIDGNKYNTVQIGTQVWMTEDLKTTRFNDGTPIEQVTLYEEWAGLTSPAYCWYNNDSTHKETYGALYNWYAVQTNNLCPEGWHVPSDEEWNKLMSNYGLAERAGGPLKEAGTDHWKNPNTGASNASGFTALPGGYRSYNGTFNVIRAFGYWWTSTESNWWNNNDSTTSIVFFRSMVYNDKQLYRNVSEKTNGFCVRCLMDQ